MNSVRDTRKCSCEKQGPGRSRSREGRGGACWIQKGAEGDQRRALVEPGARVAQRAGRPWRIQWRHGIQGAKGSGPPPRPNILFGSATYYCKFEVSGQTVARPFLLSHSFRGSRGKMMDRDQNTAVPHSPTLDPLKATSVHRTSLQNRRLEQQGPLG